MTFGGRVKKREKKAFLLLAFTLVLVIALFIKFSNVKRGVLVTSVIDGDTIVIEGGTKVRLIGIDSPEKGRPFYNETSEFVRNSILGKRVDVEIGLQKKDRYGRMLGYVWFEGELLNAKIVRNGFAVALFYFPNTKYKSKILEAEAEARGDMLGIWAENASE